MIPTLERLEGRSLLAAAGAFSGNVSARLVDGWLVVEGDAAANSLIIRRFGAPHNYQLTASGGFGTTTINGTGIARIGGVTRGIRVNMRGGDDELIISEVGPAGDSVPGAEGAAYAMRLDMGAGDDKLTMERVVLQGRSSFAGGYGHDRIALTDVRTYSDLAVLPGAGHDVTQLTRVNVAGKLALDDRQGRAWAGLEGVSVAGRTTVRTGALGDSIILRDNALGQRTRVTTLDGDDHVVVRNTTFATSALVDDGAGDDIMDREVTLSWDFRHGRQGWEAGFADYLDVRLPDGTSNLDQYDLASGLAELPAETGWRGTGFMLSGSNVSDDLFMYLSRQVGEAEGLARGIAYRLTFDVRFASDAPDGSAGAGGSPADSVFVKVGGIAREPTTRLDRFGKIELELDKGVQAHGGRDMSVAGDLDNGLSPGGIAESFRYRVVRRRHTHPQAVRADGQGRMWLLVGTDSGFEGVTTLYYVKVGVRLTPIMG